VPQLLEGSHYGDFMYSRMTITYNQYFHLTAFTTLSTDPATNHQNPTTSCLPAFQTQGQ
jgi:hypothetical protein